MTQYSRVRLIAMPIKLNISLLSTYFLSPKRSFIVIIYGIYVENSKFADHKQINCSKIVNDKLINA